MNSQVLYFPYISVPDDAWFTRVLLYWDKVGSIVPAPYAEAPAALSGYMQDLLRAELVTPVIPEAHLSTLYGPMQNFLSFLDSEIDNGNFEAGGLGDAPASRGGSEPGTVFEIHRGKLGLLVAHGLEVRGLARPARRCPWYEVESRTAAHFMAFLAVALGAEEGMDPVTDSAGHLAAFSANRDPSAAPIELLEELRASVLKALLPAPGRPVPVEELAAFKDDHGDLLVRLRSHLEDRLVDLALIDEEWARAAKLSRLEDELREQVDEIRARMDQRRWPKIVFGTLCGLVAAAIPGVGAAIAGSATAASLAAPGLVSAMYTGIPALRRGEAHMQKPLAYAALAQRQFG